MQYRTISHSAKSSKLLLKLLIIALMIIQTIIVTVVKNYYDRFNRLEQENILYDKEIEVLKEEISILSDRLIDMNQQFNAYILEKTNGT